METKNSSKGKKGETSLVKKLLYQEIEQELTSSPSAFFTRFDKLSVAEMSDLRRNLEKVAKRTLVVKHTIAKKILEKNKLSDAQRFLEGSILVTLGAKEPQAVSKTLVDFIKGRDNVELKGMIVDGSIYDGNFIKEFAKLPSRKDLLAILAARMMSPIVGMVLTLKGLIRSLVIALNEVQKKKAQGSQAPAQA